MGYDYATITKQNQIIQEIQTTNNNIITEIEQTNQIIREQTAIMGILIAVILLQSLITTCFGGRRK